LEVFCDGVRNILDVALNAEDEIFTYDNTDEHDWMGRLTHMVDGGFYGYPHDFIPRRPYTLWMMEDYGAGAATGAFAYNEDALPPEYHGNLFLADFGKRQVMRVRVERDGATYRAVSKEDLFPDPPGDFRPVGIAPGPDGKSIYICDWHHRDEKADVNVGRLLKLTWTGKDHSKPKPDWHVPAAMGKTSDVTSDGLIAALHHPSHSVRLAAQRHLIERGTKELGSSRREEAQTSRSEGRNPKSEIRTSQSLVTSAATKQLIALFRDTRAPVHARWHALWALDAIDGGQAARRDILAAAMDAEASVRRQAIRQLGERGVSEGAPALRDRLRDGDPAVRFHAATALGNIGDSAGVEALLMALDEKDPFARYAAFKALNRIGVKNPQTWSAIARGLQSNNERVREATMFALRESYDQGLLDALLTVFRDGRTSPSARNAVLSLITPLHHRQLEWKGEWWGYHPALQPPPAKNEPWAGTGTVLTTLRDGLKEKDPGLRRACIEGLAAAGDIQSAPALRDSFSRESDATGRVAILRALGAMKDSGAIELGAAVLKQNAGRELVSAAIATLEQIGTGTAVESLIAFVGQAQGDAESLSEAIVALGRLRAKSAEPPLKVLTMHTDPRVRASAIGALSRVAGAAALPTLKSALEDRDHEVRRSAVRALGDLRLPDAVPALLVAYNDEPLRADSFVALARLPDPRALNVYLDGLGSRNPSQRNTAHLAVRDIRAKVLKDLEAKADSLPAPVLTELRQIYAGDAAAERGPLFAAQIKQHLPEEYLEFAVKHAGDAARGRKLFADAGGLNCVLCHRVAGQGSDIGPDLTNIGTQFDSRALAESILFPSKAVREGYQQVIVETEDGEELSGVIKGETADRVTLRDSAGREHQLSRKSIKARRNSSLSLMPEGLHAVLSPEEFADLIAYLASLKGKAEPGVIRAP
ncbi:MAG TPA: HEAT repeat domain-containing protein, partial [Verrucomicrobiae bacterium]|nr:HEAT repeat domain-containing protein [Verrucomicrobiae bacterium]